MKKLIILIFAFSLFYFQVQAQSSAMDEVKTQLKEAINAYKSKDYDKSIELFDQFIERAPLADAYTFRGLSKSKKKDYKGAIEDYTLGLEEDFLALTALYRAAAYIETQEYYKALNDCQTVIDKDAKNQYAHYLSAKSYYLQNDYKRALKAVNIAIRISPYYQNARKLKSQIMEAMKIIQPRPNTRPDTKITNLPSIKWINPDRQETITTEGFVNVELSISSETDLADITLFLNNKPYQTKGVKIKPIKKVEEKPEPKVERPKPTKPVPVNPGPNEIVLESIYTAKVLLEKGENTIILQATNDSGTANSTAYKVIYRSTEVATKIDNVQKPNLYVLGVGVSSFENPTYNLNYADDDARDFTGAFEKLKNLPADERMFNTIKIKTILDENATRANISEQILKWKNTATEKDLVVLFLSTHGDIDETRNLYFRTYDTHDEISLLSVNGLSNKWLRDQIDNFEGTVIQFIDACHSGKAGTEYSYKSTARIPKAVNELIHALESRSTMIFSSCRKNQLSIENEKWENGAFTEALVNCLNAKEMKDEDGEAIIADMNKDGIIDTNEINAYLNQAVSVLTNAQQSPNFTSIGGEPINLFQVLK